MSLTAQQKNDLAVTSWIHDTVTAFEKSHPKAIKISEVAAELEQATRRLVFLDALGRGGSGTAHKKAVLNWEQYTKAHPIPSPFKTIEILDAAAKELHVKAPAPLPLTAEQKVNLAATRWIRDTVTAFINLHPKAINVPALKNELDINAQRFGLLAVAATSSGNEHKKAVADLAVLQKLHPIPSPVKVEQILVGVARSLNVKPEASMLTAAGLKTRQSICDKVGLDAAKVAQQAKGTHVRDAANRLHEVERKRASILDTLEKNVAKHHVDVEALVQLAGFELAYPSWNCKALGAKVAAKTDKAATEVLDELTNGPQSKVSSEAEPTANVAEGQWSSTIVAAGAVATALLVAAALLVMRQRRAASKSTAESAMLPVEHHDGYSTI